MKPPVAAHQAALPHSRAEDVHALLIGSSFVGFGLVLLKTAGLVTGGLAGVALIISYVTGWPVGILFVGLNLPFFLMAQRKLGWVFTAKSLATILALAAFSELMPQGLKLEGINPAFAAAFGGSLIGMGVLSLARHRASIGGIGIMAIYLQERYGMSAGKVQMTFDLIIVGASFPVIGLERLVYSALGAVALNMIMLVYHRPGRYFGH